MIGYENLTSEQKQQATIHRDVRNICTESAHLMGLDITKSVTDVISELVYKKLQVYGQDLEAFAKHAKRNTVNADDVKLLCRRNPSLNEHLTKASGSTMGVPKERKRKTITAAAAKPAETVTSVSKENLNFTMPHVSETPKVTSDDGIMAVDNTIDLTFD